MALATYWQKGGSIDYKNSGTATIKANEIVSLSTRIGVAGMDILPGEVGSLITEGVFVLPKDAAAISLGAAVYYIAADGDVSATKGTNGILAGYATAAAGASDTVAYVKLQG